MRTIDRAVEAFHARQWNTAGALCVEVLRINPGEPQALLILGYMNAHVGKSASALDLLQRAARVAPKDARFLSLMASAYNALGHRDRAAAAFESALGLDGDYPEAIYGLADVTFQRGDWDKADSLLARAISLKPDYADALASRANVAWWRRDFDAAEQFCKAALAVVPSHGGALVTLARVALEGGRYDDVLATTDRTLESPLNLVQRARVLGLKGEALEGLKRFDEAYEAFQEANNADQRMFGAQWASIDNQATPQRLARMVEHIDRAKPERWPRPSEGQQADAIFLVGFPRSGTTLLGQILASHPEVQTMEEADTLADAAAALVMPQRALESWEQLTPRQLDALRAAYQRRVHEVLGGAPTRPTLINKMPMNLTLLAVIHLLFPRAKIILALRDPRDVVLSCFKQRFGINAATLHFLGLGAAVSYYDAVMRTAEAARSRLPLDLHMVRYEALVADFDATVAGLLQFLSLPWNDAVRDHTAAARSTRIVTPSSTTVVLPVYSSAHGRWRHYRKQLEPHLPALAPWLRAFEYPIE